MASAAKRKRVIVISDDDDPESDQSDTDSAPPPTRKSARLAEKDVKQQQHEEEDDDLDGEPDVSDAEEEPRETRAAGYEDIWVCEAAQFDYACDPDATPFLQSQSTEIESHLLEKTPLPAVLARLVRDYLRQFTMTRVPVAFAEFANRGVVVLGFDICIYHGRFESGATWTAVNHDNEIDPAECNAALVCIPWTSRYSSKSLPERPCFKRFDWFSHIPKLLYVGRFDQNNISRVHHSDGSLRQYHDSRSRKHPGEYISFGRHRGKRFEDLPVRYLLWLSDLGNADDHDSPAWKYVESHHPKAIQSAKSLVRGRICISCAMIFRNEPKPPSKRLMCRDCDEDHEEDSAAENSDGEEAEDDEKAMDEAELEDEEWDE